MYKLLLFLLVIPVKSYACDVNIGRDQKEILIYMLRVDSEFSNDLHNRFWLPTKNCSFEERTSWSQQLLSTVPLNLEGQKAQWLSIRKSLEDRKIIFDPSYDKYLMKRAESLKSRGLPVDRLDKEKERLTDLIQSSLASEPIEISGKGVVIDMSIVDQVLNGIEASGKRLKMLLSPPKSLYAKGT
ncbi:hypothetical protein [Arenicella xantha]|uniref:Uncharacterized protein n=1 Tax=Arenicella xantha TaxID=644221 RepID=A0A395JFG6_9GAMM|nr:hypothetical protein [Arenicella xantha]RBP47016.1 hypothetical protein DFR28_11310 [Arenicella xantha]